MAFKMKGFSGFKKGDEKPRFKTKKFTHSADPNSVDKAVKEALEKNRLAKIEREKKYGVKGVDY
tara:strand:- start:64 stop:255 length:192 start_codon:yes stop_codon:yes gene_type:complete